MEKAKSDEIIFFVMHGSKKIRKENTIVSLRVKMSLDLNQIGSMYEWIHEDSLEGVQEQEDNENVDCPV